MLGVLLEEAEPCLGMFGCGLLSSRKTAVLGNRWFPLDSCERASLHGGLSASVLNTLTNEKKQIDSGEIFPETRHASSAQLETDEHGGVKNRQTMRSCCKQTSNGTSGVQVNTSECYLSRSFATNP
eukprot:6193658-Pleurochrysis_carterae.AAC.1